MVAASVASAKLPLPEVLQTRELADATDAATTYTPSAGDVTAGSVLLTITTNMPGACAAATDSMMLMLDAFAQADAGADATVCETDLVSLSGAIGGSANAASWNTNGSGSFANANDVATTYTPSPADAANGSVLLTLTTMLAGACPTVTDSMVITLDAVAQADAGADATICETDLVSLSGAIGGSASALTWTSSGTGNFANATDAATTYTPSAADANNGSVVLTITTNMAGACPAATDNMVLTLDRVAMADAGSDATICETDVASLSGAIGGSASALTWTSSGTGSFADAADPGTVYTPSAADIMAGSVLLTLTTDAPGACPSASDAMTLLLDPVAEVDAGPDSTICNTCSYTLDGVLAGAANTGTWTTSGTGTFNNAQLLDATYTPSAQDIANGSVTLTLTSDDPTGPCAAVADDMLLTIAIANGIESQRTVAPLRVFPNPASTGQQLQFGKLLHNVRVYSASGALIQQHAQTASIALEAQGMYLLVSAEGTAEIIVQ